MGKKQRRDNSGASRIVLDSFARETLLYFPQPRSISWPVVETIFRSWRALHFACHLDRAKRELTTGIHRLAPPQKCWINPPEGGRIRFQPRSRTVRATVKLIRIGLLPLISTPRILSSSGPFFPSIIDSKSAIGLGWNGEDSDERERRRCECGGSRSKR